MKITQLTVENVKRVQAVEITPQGHLIVVGGKNAQGKSSVLDAILYAFAGKRSIPEKPLREGETEGRVVVKLDGDPTRHLAPLAIERVFERTKTGNVTTRLEIRTDDAMNAQAPSPQAILDELWKRAFDPVEFVRMPVKAQVELLRGMLGLDFTEQDEEREATYHARTRMNAEAKSAAARLAAMPHHADAPAEEVSVAQLSQELAEANTHNAQCDRARQAALASRRLAEELGAQIAEVVAAIEALRLKARGLEERRGAAETVAEADEIAADSMSPRDTNAIVAKMTSAEETNRKVRENAIRAELAGKVRSLKASSDELTADIDKIDAAKQEAIANAEWPVEGMGFSPDGGLTYRGLPFEQASSAEQLKVSVGIGAAANPDLPVLLVRAGSMLDDDSLAELARIAEARDAQVFVERVSEGAECSVVIEDGRVRPTERNDDRD